MVDRRNPWIPAKRNESFNYLGEDLRRAGLCEAALSAGSMDGFDATQWGETCRSGSKRSEVPVLKVAATGPLPRFRPEELSGSPPWDIPANQEFS